MSANPSTNEIAIFECNCPLKHRFSATNKTEGNGVICQDDGKYRLVGTVTQQDGESYATARTRAMLKKFETVN